MRHHSKLFYLLTTLSISAFMLIVSCDEELITGFIPDKDLPTLFGTVNNSSTNSGIDSVKISWYDDRGTLGLQSVYTDTNGYYSIPGIPYGPHTFNISKSGYGDMKVYKKLSPALVENSASTSAEAAILDDYRQENNMTMYPLTSGISGTVYKRSDAENTIVADSVTVNAYVGLSTDGSGNCENTQINDTTNLSSSEFVPSYVTTTTDTLGKYSFTNLPAGLCATLLVMPHSDGTNNYSIAAQDGLLWADSNFEWGNITVGFSTYPSTIEVLNNNFKSGYVDVSENITFTFSHAMDPASIVVTLKAASTAKPFDVSWTNAYMLVVNPRGDLSSGTEHTITVEGVATDGSMFESNKITQTFTTVSTDNITELWRSIDSDDNNQVSVGDSIKIRFSKKPYIDNVNTSVVLTNEDATDDPWVKTTLTVPATDSTLLIIDPEGDALRNGTNYKLTYKVYASATEDSDNTGTDPVAFTFKTKSSYAAVPAKVTAFAKDTTAMGPNGTYTRALTDNLTTYHFDWASVDNAEGYKIYAKDDHNNPDYVDVTKGASGVGNDETVDGIVLIPDRDAVNMHETTISLSTYTQFDRYYDETTADQTPLADITLSFVITALNDNGESVISDVLTFNDNAKPTTASDPAQSATANNASDATNAKTITVTIEFSEIMNVSADPVVEAPEEAGGDVEYVLPSSAVSAVWNSDGRGITITLVIPKEKNASGDTIKLKDSQFKDLTSNVKQVSTTETFITRTLN